MATATLQLCDLCGVPLEGYHPKHGKKVRLKKQGLVMEIGYSDGGWGQRKDHLNFSGEVCMECYHVAMRHVNNLIESLHRRENQWVERPAGEVASG